MKKGEAKRKDNKNKRVVSTSVCPNRLKLMELTQDLLRLSLPAQQFIVWIVDANPANRAAALELGQRVNALLKEENGTPIPRVQLQIVVFDSVKEFREGLQKISPDSAQAPNLVLTGLRFEGDPNGGLTVYKHSLLSRILCYVITGAFPRSGKFTEMFPGHVESPVLPDNGLGTKPYELALSQFARQLASSGMNRPVSRSFWTWLSSITKGGEGVAQAAYDQVERKINSLRAGRLPLALGYNFSFIVSAHPPQASGSGAQGRRPARVPTRLPLVGAAP